MLSGTQWPDCKPRGTPVAPARATAMLPTRRRALAAIAAGSAPIHTSSAARGLMLTLERSIGESAGKDAALRATGAFSAEIFPDLPIATTWENLWKVIRKQHSQGGANTASLPEDVAQGTIKVMTVAANLRKMEEVEARMRACTTSGPTTGSPTSPNTSSAVLGIRAAPAAPPVVTGRAADALLLVAGSHPVRSLPGTRQLLPGSVALLQLASRLRLQGQIPSGTQLWAVANPNVEPDASGVERKVENGAQVIVTQPPFNRDAFAKWVEDARRRGVLEGARLLVGHPMISSAGNLAFWLSLSSCAGQSYCQALVRQLTLRETEGKAAVEQWCDEYNTQLTKQVLSWSGVGGFHMMPITAKGKKATIDALKPEGVLHAAAVRQQTAA